MATRTAIVMPVPSSYGAIELKEFIRKYTYKGFIYTAAGLIILLLEILRFYNQIKRVAYIVNNNLEKIFYKV